jgi:hypothetical protein
MARTRPTSVTVMGVLNLVLSILAILLLICGGVFLALQQGGGGVAAPPPGQANTGMEEIQEYAEEFQRQLPSEWLIAGWISRVSQVLALAALLASGIGLLRMRRWGRTLAVVAGGLMLLIAVVGLTSFFAGTQPASERAAAVVRQKPRPPKAQPPPITLDTAITFGTVATLVGCGLALGLGLLELATMLSGSVRLAFGTAPADERPGEPEDYDDRSR